MLRPFMLATVWLAMFLLEFGPFIKSFFKKINAKKVLGYSAFVLGLLTVLWIVYPTVQKKVHSYKYNATHLITKGYEERAKLRKADDVIDASNMPKAIFMSHVRYIVTPMPHSIIKRMFSSGLKSEYGKTSEFLRLYTLIVYYFALVWLLINIKSVVRTIGALGFQQKAILLWLFAFLPIYSIAHFGGSHQRLKLPFQLLVLILFIYTRKFKKNKRNLT
ncbi:hypothetical protein FVB32_04880 [Flagellimonas hymeniacidonis]|uniref:Uncharacterized protein n=1 Tax=Flagellimonas hymeniacidonis TaxID=2603628 RepID=A0A5C8V8D1_9FLAO|nr:hypothetical protein [Flagellimonas hymeniacidonis]TXN37626.1 hypothetical protein FVB32_04880 [Flagellimonas hymeniacidonis]